MKTKEELFKSKIGKAHFHDAVFEASHKSLDDAELEALFESLPKHIRNIAHEWGLSDTVFRDEVCAWVREHGVGR